MRLAIGWDLRTVRFVPKDSVVRFFVASNVCTIARTYVHRRNVWTGGIFTFSIINTTDRISCTCTIFVLYCARKKCPNRLIDVDTSEQTCLQEHSAFLSHINIHWAFAIVHMGGKINLYVVVKQGAIFIRKLYSQNRLCWRSTSSTGYYIDRVDIIWRK